MNKKYNLKELHELTEKEREEIYRYAMKRSKEIVNGKSNREVEDEPVPIYGAPASPVESPHPKIKEWNSEFGLNAYKNIKLIRMLKLACFSQEQIVSILEILEKVCPSCWDGTERCQCRNDR